MKVLRKHFDSALLDLAQRGYLDMYVESKEVGFLRKSVAVKSFEVRLSAKGKSVLQSMDADLKRYERTLLNTIGIRPIDKEELSRIRDNQGRAHRERFGRS